MKINLSTVVLVILIGIVAACGGARDKGPTWQKGPMPEGGNFDGVYSSDFGRLELTVQMDGRVTGLYEGEQHNGRIEGSVGNNILRFNWTQWNQEMRGKIRETSGEGVFQYIVEDIPVAGGKIKQDTKLLGWWGYDRGKMNNRWNAYKLKRSKKKLKPFDQAKSELEESEDPNATAGFSESAEPESSSGSDDTQEAEEEPEEESGGLDDIF